MYRVIQDLANTLKINFKFRSAVPEVVEKISDTMIHVYSTTTATIASVLMFICNGR